jgi:hypothetical protein
MYAMRRLFLALYFHLLTALFLLDGSSTNQTAAGGKKDSEG